MTGGVLNPVISACSDTDTDQAQLSGQCSLLYQTHQLATSAGYGATDTTEFTVSNSVSGQSKF